MRVPFHILTLAGLVLMPAGAWTGAIGEAGMPQRLSLEELERTLSRGTRLMVHPAAIEKFLEELDGAPPDWASLYGHGHQDPVMMTGFLPSTGSGIRDVKAMRRWKRRWLSSGRANFPAMILGATVFPSRLDRSWSKLPGGWSVSSLKTRQRI